MLISNLEQDVKVTPAHDMNDKTLERKHNLEIIDIFNEDAQ
jgi:valyl-tRNA synthetase